MKKAASTTQSRQITFALAAFLLGVWAFIKVNSVSGPVFEPIVAACTNPDISPEEFASKTGYHEYEPIVGLKVFNFLVCLITQFLLELRETYPAGILVWCGVIVVAIPVGVISTFQAGRAGARGPIRYPTCVGLLYQLFGISVMFPLVWVPSYILGCGTRGAPLTTFRTVSAAILTVPGIVMTCIIFTAPTDSYLWTVSAGMLGGPILPMLVLVLWRDASSSLEPTVHNVEKTAKMVENVLNLTAAVAFVGYMYLIKVVNEVYGTSLTDLWKDIWVEANGSVAFMTIDTGVLYLALVLLIAFHDAMKAVKTLLMTIFIGPAAACLTWKEIELEAASEYVKEIKAGKKKD